MSGWPRAPGFPSWIFRPAPRPGCFLVPLLLQMLLGQCLQQLALYRFQIARPLPGSRPGVVLLVQRPDLKRSDELDLIDETVLQSEQPEEQIAVGGDSGHGTGLPRRSNRKGGRSSPNVGGLLSGRESDVSYYRIPDYQRHPGSGQQSCCVLLRFADSCHGDHRAHVQPGCSRTLWRRIAPPWSGAPLPVTTEP